MNKAGTVPALTGIRFFAAVYVLLFHYGASALTSAGVPPWLSTFLHNGTFGVSAFFVLSGFILSHAHPRLIAGPLQYCNYLMSRFGRIYPVYLLALLVSIPLIIARPPLTPGRALAVLLMLQSWGNALSENGWSWLMQAWTLSVEFCFYLLFPFLVAGIRRLSPSVLISLCLLDAVTLIGCGIAGVAPGSTFGGSEGIPTWVLFVPLPLTRTVEFVFGIALQTLVSRVPARSYGSALLLAICAAIVALLSSSRNAHVMSCASVLIGMLIALIYCSDNAFTRLLGSRLFYVLGSASYAMYLLQHPCREYVVRLWHQPIARLCVLPITVAVSVMVWHFFEEPMRRLIRRFRFREPARSAGPFAVMAPAREGQLPPD